MITGLVALATAHVASLVGGVAAASAVEVALPWITRAHRIRQATNLARRVHRRRVGKPLPESEYHTVRREYA